MVQFKQAQPENLKLDNRVWGIFVPGIELEQGFFNFNPGKQDYNYKLHSSGLYPKSFE